MDLGICPDVELMHIFLQTFIITVLITVIFGYCDCLTLLGNETSVLNHLSQTF